MYSALVGACRYSIGNGAWKFKGFLQEQKGGREVDKTNNKIQSINEFDYYDKTINRLTFIQTIQAITVLILAIMALMR